MEYGPNGKVMCSCGREERRDGQSHCRVCHREYMRKWNAKNLVGRQNAIDRAVDLFLRWMADIDDYEENVLRQETQIWLREVGIEHWNTGASRSTARKERDVLIQFVLHLKETAADGVATITAEELNTMFPEIA